MQAEIRLAVGTLPYVRIWRNNTTELSAVSVPTVLGLLAKAQYHLATAALKSAPRIKSGLAVGSADLIGIVLPFGRFLSIEVKSDSGRMTQAQTDWIKIVRSFGGVAGVARNVEEALALVEEARALP